MHASTVVPGGLGARSVLLLVPLGFRHSKSLRVGAAALNTAPYDYSLVLDHAYV